LYYVDFLFPISDKRKVHYSVNIVSKRHTRDKT